MVKRHLERCLFFVICCGITKGYFFIFILLKVRGYFVLNKVYCFIIFLFIIACSGYDDGKSESKTVSLIVDGAFDDKGFNESSSKAIKN